MEPVNIEAVLIEWLSARLSIAAYADVPNERPRRFLTVERVGGGGESPVVDRPRVAVQCWAESRALAADLAMQVSGQVMYMTGIPRVAKATRGSVVNFPDLIGGNPRYQVVLDLVTTQ